MELEGQIVQKASNSVLQGLWYVLAVGGKPQIVLSGRAITSRRKIVLKLI